MSSREASGATASGALSVEGRYSINSYLALQKLGHDISLKLDYDPYFGGVHAILYDYNKGILYGGADPRRDGQAAAF